MPRDNQLHDVRADTRYFINRNMGHPSLQATKTTSGSFVYLYTSTQSIQDEIVEYAKSNYLDEFSTVDKV